MIDLGEVLTQEERKNIFKKGALQPKIISVENTTKNKPLQFQRDVFRHLTSHKAELNINQVFAVKNSFIDGIIELENGKLILCECKLNLNWFKACNARTEFQMFLKKQILRELKIEGTPHSAIIFFEEFSNDWKEDFKKYNCTRGWINFYDEQEHYKDEFNVDIIQFQDKKLYNIYSKRI